MRLRGGARLVAITLVAATAAVPVAAAGPTEDTGPGRARPEGQAAGSFAPDAVLVRFKPTTPALKVSRILEATGAETLQSFDIVPGLRLVRLPPGLTVGEAVELYGSRPEVLYAEPNFVWRAAGTRVTPDDPAFGSMWNLDNRGQTGGTPDADIDAPEAWSISRGSPDVVVAVIDTGVDYLHVDLAPNIWENPEECDGAPATDDDGNGFADDCHGIDTFNDDGDPMDDNGHGTHVAGTIGARGDNGVGVVGVNWRIRIMACKFLGSLGVGFTSDAITCLEYVRLMKSRGVNVIATNNSWGSSAFSQALHDAVATHVRAGILFIAAAGAAGDDMDSEPFFPASLFLPNVIAVTATTHTDTLPPFADFGARSVHVAAPGRTILSTVPGDDYDVRSGTSLAVPHVTGLAALLEAADHRRNWVTIRNLILTGGDRTQDLAGTTISGRRINAHGSLDCSGRRLAALLKPAPAVVGRGPVTIAALNVECGRPAGPLSVNVTPGVGPIALADDGVAPDLARDDGIYSGSWTPSLCDIGQFTLSLTGGAAAAVQVGGAAGTYRCGRVDADWRAIGGTSLDLDDDGVAPITTPFPVRFGAEEFTTLNVGANGAVSFHETRVGPGNRDLPTTTFTTLIAPFWDDLLPIPGTGQNVFVDVLGSEPHRELVIEWRNVSHFVCRRTPAAAVTFQVVFREGSADVLFVYRDISFGGACSIPDAGASATVGIQLTGTDASQLSRNFPILERPLAILWSWPCTVTGTAGDDVLTGTDGDDVVCGLEGNDTLVGTDGDDTLVGGGGDDLLQGGGGQDLLRGGAGADTASFSASPRAVTVDLGSGTARGDGGDDLSGIERVVGSPFADVLTGDAGANVLAGGGGDDVLLGGPGDDVLRGGGGVDTVDYSRSPAAVTVDLGTGAGSGQGSDVVSGVERVVGSPFADTLTGRGGAEVLVGRAGNDTIDGGRGGDLLRGGSGEDTVAGGPGGDVLTGGPDPDLLSGGRGGDRLLARDGGPDRASGGRGRDVARVDPGLDRTRGVEALL